MMNNETTEMMTAAPSGARELDPRNEADAALLRALLELLHANAAESPEWIRARIAPVLERAKGGAA